MKLVDRFTPADYASLEDFYANYTMTVPENFNFAIDVIDEYARLCPDQRAMIWCDEKEEEHIFTFGDMHVWSIKAANALLRMGVRPGDPVLLMLKRRYEYWFLALGLMRLHCIQIPATHQLQKKDIVYRANAADITAIICVGEEEVLHHVSNALPESPTIRAIAALGGEFDGFLNFDKLLREAPETIDTSAVSKDSSDVMLMYFTSGTTGMPKMVAHDFTYPLGHLITGRFWHNLDENSIHLTTADSGWAKCGWGKLYGQWIAGATLFVYDFDKFNPRKMLEVLEKYRVTSFCAPPTIYRFMIKEDMSKYDLSSLKWGTVAGEPLNPEVYQQFYRATGVQLREGFGQTETTPLLLTPKWMEPRPGSIGKPSPHYTIRLMDETGRDVEDGEEGEICVDLSKGHPAGLFKGYYRDPERTAEAFAGGVYHTGDMAWRDEEGYYWFIGRADDVIKSSGYRIGPFEVESALIEHPAVLECAITGVPDPDRGQVVKATIMLAKGYTPSDALKKELQNHVKQATAPYKYPRIIEFVEDLPKTISGKIQRKKLREHDKKSADHANTNWAQSVAGVVIRDGKVLLARHTYGAGKDMLIIPGGYAENGETPQDALKREFLEETGVTVEPKNIVGVRFNAHDWYIAFSAEYISGEARSDHSENSEVVWMDIAEALSREDVPDLTKKLIECTVKGEGLVPMTYESKSQNGPATLYGVNIL